MLEPEEPEPEDSDEEVPEITPDDVSDGPEIVDDSENDAPFDSGESDDDVEAEPPEAGTAPKQAKLEGRSGHGPRNAPKGNSPRTFTLDDVLSLPNRRLGAAIVDVLEECSNYSSKKDDLVKRVTKHFGFRTSGEPRKKLSRKIGWAVTHLKKAGLVEEYKAKNVRVRLRNPSRQGRLSFPDGATVRDNSKTESQQEAALDEE
jgi:hypothetical protein